MNDATKVCRGCGYEQPLVNFSPKKRAAGGYNPVCKACVRAEYRKNNPPREDSYTTYRNFAIRRTPSETTPGAVRVSFGDKARMQPEGEHRGVRKAGAQSSLRLFEGW